MIDMLSLPISSQTRRRTSSQPRGGITAGLSASLPGASGLLLLGVSSVRLAPATGAGRCRSRSSISRAMAAPRISSSAVGGPLETCEESFWPCCTLRMVGSP